MGTVAEQHDERRAGVTLSALEDRIAPLTMAHERTLPVPAVLAGLFAEGALVRGRVLSCAGTASTTSALALMAPAVEAGAWLAVIDVPTVGLDAANELGIRLDRVVGVDLGERRAEVWPDVVAAAADGFELILTRVPHEVRPAAARSVVARLQQRGVLLVVLGEPGPLPCDGVVESTDRGWEGLGDGFGHLHRRTVQVVASGRRLPGKKRCTVSFRGPRAGSGTLVAGSVADPDLVRAG